MQAHVKCCPSRVGDLRMDVRMLHCTTLHPPACLQRHHTGTPWNLGTQPVPKPGEAVRAAAVAASHPHLEISGDCGAGDCGGDGCVVAHDGTLMLATDVLVLLRRHDWRTGSSSASQSHRC
jgi:hypothetical protein